MSFEGYYQCLCKNGHRSSEDVYSNTGDEICPHCEEPIVWWNLVDQTNGEEIDFIPDSKFDTLLLTKEATEYCATCHQVKTTIPATYRIPTDEELLDLRTVFIGGELMSLREWEESHKEEI